MKLQQIGRNPFTAVNLGFFAAPPPPSEKKNTITMTMTAMADRSSALLLAFLLVVGTLPEALAVGGGRQGTRTFSVLSRPIYLKYGEVHNTIQDPIRLPQDLVREFASKPMAIVDYSVDIVDKEGTRVPLYDGYNRKS